jgi:hypothetical protein
VISTRLRQSSLSGTNGVSVEEKMKMAIVENTTVIWCPAVSSILSNAILSYSRGMTTVGVSLTAFERVWLGGHSMFVFSL